MRHWALLTFICSALLVQGPVWAAGDGGGHGGDSAPKKQEGGGFLSSAPVYVSVGPLLLPVILQDGAHSNLTMMISLQVKDLATSDKVREKMPRLIDAYMRALYGRFDETTMRDGRLVNLDFVKNKLVRSTQAVMGPDIVQDVLIQAVAQRQLTPG